MKDSYNDKRKSCKQTTGRDKIKFVFPSIRKLLGFARRKKATTKKENAVSQLPGGVKIKFDSSFDPINFLRDLEVSCGMTVVILF